MILNYIPKTVSKKVGHKFIYFQNYFLIQPGYVTIMAVLNNSRIIIEITVYFLNL